MTRPISLLLLVPAALAFAQGRPARPHVSCLAHVALYTHDIEASRAYYRDVLGYPELPPSAPAGGSAALASFKINDRQSIDLMPEREVGGDRLAHIAFETNDLEAMRVYLASRGVPVPDRIIENRAGLAGFTVPDPDGHLLEFVHDGSARIVAKVKGPKVPVESISSVMRHAGILVGSLEAATRFYRDVLGFREIWRGSRDGKTLDWVNMKLPDSDDYIEFMLYADLPEPGRRGSQHHICLVVPDVDAAAATVRTRAARARYTRAIEPRTGINRKRQLNLFDPDGTRSELMEPGTVDGKPVPSSEAPPPRR